MLIDHFKKVFINFMGNIRLFLITNFVFCVQNFAFKKKKICRVLKVKNKFKNIKINIGEVILD